MSSQIKMFYVDGAKGDAIDMPLVAQIFAGDLVIDVDPSEEGPRVWVGRDKDGLNGWSVFIHRGDGQVVARVVVPDDVTFPATIEIGEGDQVVQVDAAAPERDEEGDA